MTRKFAPPPTKFGTAAPSAQAKTSASPHRGDVVPPPPTRFGPSASAQAKPMAPPRPTVGGTVQAMLPGTINTGNWPVGPFDQRDSEDIGLRMHGLNVGSGVAAGKLRSYRVGFKGHGHRPHFKDSRKNIETQSLKNRARLVKGGVKRIGALKAKETEVLGEVAAMKVMMHWPSMQGYEMVMPVSPGHGRGIDQFWMKGPAIAPAEYLIVEAKGPGAKLAPRQMTKAWVLDRLRRLVNGDTPLAVKNHAQAAINAINSNTRPPVVRGIVLTAKWDIPGETLTATKSKDVCYN